jgi:hypothetical protein
MEIRLGRAEGQTADEPPPPGGWACTIHLPQVAADEGTPAA